MAGRKRWVLWLFAVGVIGAVIAGTVKTCGTDENSATTPDLMVRAPGGSGRSSNGSAVQPGVARHVDVKGTLRLEGQVIDEQ